MKASHFIYIGLLMPLLWACNSKGTQAQQTDNAVAKAGEEYLSREDLYAGNVLLTEEKDSTVIKQRLIENWAKESLFYQEAKNKLYENELSIEKQVEAYRKELINYVYQTKIIEANLDTSIDMNEISDYYNRHRDNFILKENIVKVNYLKVPLKAPPIEKIKRFVMSSNPADMNQLKTLCAQHAENYFLNDSTWLFMDEIRREIPAMKDQPDVAMYVGRVVQYADDSYFYFLKIKDVKVKNGLSPLNFERQNIKKFILNARKTALIQQYKQILLEKAKAEKKYVLY